MIKKLLFSLILLFTSFLMQGQITLTTTLNSNTWSPVTVTNSGDQLVWTAASNGDFLGQTVNANDPVFDFSANVNNLPIIITITNNSNDFSGLTAFDFYNDNGGGSEITDIDVTNATALVSLNMRYNRLSTLDITHNTALTTLNIRGNRQLAGQTLNTTNNTQLASIEIDGTRITNVDFSSNNQLSIVHIQNAKLPTAVLDQVVNDLDAHGLSNGTLKYVGNPGNLSYHSYTAYNNLTGKGWAIDPPVPPSGPNIETITFTTTSNQSGWQLGRLQNTGLTLHWKAEGIGITTQEFDDNRPIFDFSLNTNNDPITITITSEEGFDYLTEMSLYIGTPSIHNESGIYQIDIANADALLELYPAESNLDQIDVSQNINLKRLLIHGVNTQLGNQFNNFLDISANPDMYSLFVSNTTINSLSSLLQNQQLYTIDLSNSKFPSSVLDQVLIDLDQNGISNPPSPDLKPNHITLANNPGSLTSASHAAYNSLIAKGWTIDVAAPPAAPGPDINITGLGNTIPNNNTPQVSDDTNFGQIQAGDIITKTFTIENLGDQPLDLTGDPDLVAISGANASDFTISALPTTPIAIGGNTTFEVTFNAGSLGIRDAILTIESNDPDEALYVINIQAESTQASGAEINVTGNGQSIPSGNSPNVVDDTDFGQVAIGSPITKTFTIENLGNSDLTINYFFTNTSNYFSFDPSGGGGIVLGSEASTTIDATFNPSTIGVQTGTITIVSDDPDEGTYVINLTAEGIPASSGTIDVQGNGISITNGDTTPDIADDTDFGPVLNSTTKTTTYTIYNTHATENLTISAITVPLNPEFQMGAISETLPFDIVPGGSITFDVDFAPTSTGNYTGAVQIDNSDSDPNPFQYNIAGQGADNVVTGDIMITQYYEGTGSNDQWIEIKNISGGPIAASTYYLCLYDDSKLPVTGLDSPTANVAIPAMVADQVVLFQNIAAALPSGNLGVTPEPSDNGVCSFSGNDVILISTTTDGTCYGNRQDLIGDQDPQNNRWGGEASFIRGGCASETPSANFDINDWIKLPLTEVNTASVNTNIALGTQFVGDVTWTGANWENGFIDRTRNAIIAAPYSANNGSIIAYSLTVNDTLDFNNPANTTNYIDVYKDLTINAPFIIGDESSLYTRGDVNATISGNITKIENTTSLIDIHDNTYWSTPVSTANLNTVFDGVNPDRIFFLNGGDIGDFAPPYDHWFVANGGMAIAKGYAVEGSANQNVPGVQTFRFTGVPNSGDKSISVTYKGSNDEGQENDNFNLLGNPFPSAFDLDSFLSNPENDDIENTVYLWNHATINTNGEFNPADYGTYVLGNGGTATVPGGAKFDGSLASSQGFMVRTIAENKGNVTFRNSDRIVGRNSHFFKQSNSKNKNANGNEKDRVWLNLTTNDGGFSQILVGFFDGATDGKDTSFDGLKLKAGNPITFYSLIDNSNSKYVIQGLSSFTTDKTVALGFDTEIEKTFIIGIDQIEGALKDSDIYLVDHLLNVTHDLKASDYTFEQTATGSFPDRFTLQFAGQALGVDDDIFANNEFIISNDVDGFKINSAKEVKDIKVYDLLGRMIIQKQPNKKSFNIATTSIKNGTVLIVKATLENGTEISKKSIKY